MLVNVTESNNCTTVTFDKNKTLLTFDIWSRFSLSEEQIWLYILSLFDIPSYEVWREYNPDLNPEYYNLSSNFAMVIWKFFGSDYLGEKIDEFGW